MICSRQTHGRQLRCSRSPPPPDRSRATAISTVVGVGGAAGAGVGALFTMLVSHYFSLRPLIIFVSAAFAYIIALIIFQILVPRLGAPSAPEIPLSTT